MQRIPAKKSDLSRQAFTLVELLVTMSIIVVLAAISVSGFRSAYDSDRVGEAASILRGGIEGARSRAIRAKEARGIRLLLDPNDRRLVTSIVYIGTPEVITGHLRMEFDNTTTTEGSSQGQWRVFDVSELVSSSNRVNWRELYRRGLLRPQCDIEINGTKYQMIFRSQYGSAIPGEDDAWVISATPPTTLGTEITPVTSPPSYRPTVVGVEPTEPGANIGLPTAEASLPVPYTLTLMPAVLEGAAPVNLPVNTCVDLDGSKVPESWRPQANNRAYGPAFTVPPPTNYEVRPMDIMFNPRGIVTNQYVTEGFFHFRLADRRDVEAARTNLNTYLPNTTNSYLVVKDPEYPAKVVTLVTNTGMLRITNVNGAGETADPPVYNNELITTGNPFLNGILGKEAKQ